MSRRNQIKLEEAELLELLERERIAVVSSLGPRGWPHSMPMWFVPRSGEVWVWTYAKSQKVRNLERDPRATVLVETGHEYGELRGAAIEAEAEVHRDPETVLAFAEELTLRYAAGISSVEGDARAALPRRSRRRRRSGSRSTSGRCGPPPGTTASWAGPTEGPATPATK
jgi:PPOX class probable F420-dependent enzyme